MLQILAFAIRKSHWAMSQFVINLCKSSSPRNCVCHLCNPVWKPLFIDYEWDKQAIVHSISISIFIPRGSRCSNRKSVELATRGCGFESRLRQDLSTTALRSLSKAPNPQMLPGCRSVGCPLLQVCVHLDGLNAENTFHCWLYSV